MTDRGGGYETRAPPLLHSFSLEFRHSVFQALTFVENNELTKLCTRNSPLPSLFNNSSSRINLEN